MMPTKSTKTEKNILIDLQSISWQSLIVLFDRYFRLSIRVSNWTSKTQDNKKIIHTAGNIQGLIDSLTPYVIT